MKILSTLTRMWLLRSFKPFKFTNEFDRTLLYENCKGLGLYVHIPFCKKICKFCPYCKELYFEEKIDKYIDSVVKEIKLVTRNQKEKKKVTSLYFGGGSPALAGYGIKKIIDELDKHFIIKEGIGIELHPDDINIKTLQMLKEIGITKISIGVQSFQKKFLNILGRSDLDYGNLFNSLNKIEFETVSMDFIFALPNQTLDDLISDVETAFEAGANHIAIYPFIDFSFAKNSIKPMSKREKKRLMDDITKYFQKNGYYRDSIWTFSKGKDTKYSSMTRDNFLGFGCSATTLLNNQFKINTFSVSEYERKISENSLATSLTLRFTKRQRMIYYLFWTAYTTRIKEKDFEEFFDIPLKKVYGFEFWLAQKLGYFKRDDEGYEMTLKGAFYYHHYESFYTLAYIDKMWGIMRKEAFPSKLKL